MKKLSTEKGETCIYILLLFIYFFKHIASHARKYFRITESIIKEKFINI